MSEEPRAITISTDHYSRLTVVHDLAIEARKATKKYLAADMGKEEDAQAEMHQANIALNAHLDAIIGKEGH